MELKEEIEEASGKVAEFRGKRKAHLETLKTKFNCNNLSQAKKKLSKLKEDIEELEQRKQEEIEQLEKDFDL